MRNQRSSLHSAALEQAQVLQQNLAQAEAACLALDAADQTQKAQLHCALQEAQAAQTALQQQLNTINQSANFSTQAIANPNDRDTGYPSTEITSRSSETWFWRLFEESQDPTFILEDGRFIDCNQAAVKAMQCANKSDLLSLNPGQLSPEFQPDGRSSAEKANEMIKTTLRQGGHRFEWLHRRLDGEDFWVEVQLTPLEMNGRQILYATWRDISDRKAAEAELYEQEQLLRSTYEGVEYNIVIIDVSSEGEFRFIGWNPATEKHTGITSEFALGKTPEQLLGREQGAILRQNYQRCLNLGKSITYEEYVPLRGHDRWWLTTLNPLKNEKGKIYRIVLTTFEITDRKLAEAKLQQKEAQYRSVFEAMNDGILISDLETGELVTANPAAYNLFGYTYEEFVQLQPSDYVHSDSLPLFAQFLETVRAGKRFYCEAVDIRKDGTLIDVEVTGVSLLYDGKPHALSVVRDISDRKAAENALQETNSLLNSVLETIPGFFFAKDLDGRHVVLNSNLANFFGKPIDEIIGKTDADLFSEDRATTIMLEDQEVMTQEITQRFESVVPVGGVDHTYLIVKTPLHDPEGKIVGLIGLAQDISDRKAMEISLQQSEQRFRDVTEAAGEYIWEMSAEGQYTFVTERVIEVKGYSPAELLGHSPFEFMPKADVVHAASMLQKATVNKSAFSLEHRNILPSGNVIWEAVSGVPILDDQGGIIGFRGTGLSITERKVAETALTQKAEELEQTLQELQRAQLRMIQNEKMSSLGQLVAGVAHEINNPVSFIYSNIPPANHYTQDLLRLVNLYQTHYPDPLPKIRDEIKAIDLEFVKQDLPKILVSMKLGAERIRQIIGSLRTFSRLDEADCKEVDIHAGLDSTLVILGHRIKATSERPAIQIIKDYGELGLVECYAGQLNQVFMNILANALDALEERDRHRSHQDIQQFPSTITIRTHSVGSDRIAIHILDNGSGMPKAIQQRVFDPFFTTKPVGQGTGMGMSISHQIITENHGGTIQCFSSPGQETEFIIEIPRSQGTY
ncbi:PAS domain S-box protein [Vacuolonema iberomarrocanum]|uniref:PAS domain-containing sensor histidine kinase n=1 Tax=Vacuolonema iberomarrocanum TaxID=3454632 RepID=UPI001A019547|nr:PAS domain S-box protein [filamentous cyanobacterium LEGE 07170]